MPSTGGTFTPDEVGLDVIEALASMDTGIAVDVQGFVRVTRGGLLGYEEWPEQDAILSHVAVLKTDAAEAEILTGPVSGLPRCA